MTDEQTVTDVTPDQTPAIADTDETSEISDTETGESIPPESGRNTDEPDTFPREYVEQLRKEAADARVKVKDRDTLAERLHVANVAATGRLADPTDLPFDEAYLDDEHVLTEAIDALLERKPHLASRRPVGDIGQGASTGAESVSLAGILRANAN